MVVLQVPVKKLLIPPSTMNTPTAMLTIRLKSISTLSWHLEREYNIQDVCEVHCDSLDVSGLGVRSDLQGLVVANR
jgi:hypothetical protein